MAHKLNRFFVNKKKSGDDVNLELFLQSHTPLSNVQKMQIELWVKDQAIALLTNFRLKFPEI